MKGSTRVYMDGFVFFLIGCGIVVASWQRGVENQGQGIVIQVL